MICDIHVDLVHKDERAQYILNKSCFHRLIMVNKIPAWPLSLHVFTTVTVTWQFLCILGKVMLLVIFAEEKSKKKINER